MNVAFLTLKLWVTLTRSLSETILILTLLPGFTKGFGGLGPASDTPELPCR